MFTSTVISIPREAAPNCLISHKSCTKLFQPDYKSSYHRVPLPLLVRTISWWAWGKKTRLGPESISRLPSVMTRVDITPRIGLCMGVVQTLPHLGTLGPDPLTAQVWVSTTRGSTNEKTTSSSMKAVRYQHVWPIGQCPRS